jgi:prefoldin subunit 5
VRKIALPTDETQYLSIFQEKTEALLLLEKSNDQLLKIKKDLEEKIEELYR